MSYGGTRFMNSPTYHYERYKENKYPTGSTSSTARAHGSTYTAPPINHSTRSHCLSTNSSSYTPSSYSTSVRSRPVSKTRYRSPSRNRDVHVHDYIRSTPTDTAGRPLPKGPGTRDHLGKPIDHREHLHTLKHNLNRSNSLSRELRQPLKADHSYGTLSTESSISRKLNQTKRTSSVVDLTSRFDDVSVGSTKRYSSNADLRSTTSSQRLGELPSSLNSTRKNSYLLGDTSPLPDINRSNRTSRSPSVDDRDTSLSRQFDATDLLSNSSRTGHESYLNRNLTNYDSNHTKTNGYLSNGSADYNNNNKGVVGLLNIGNTCFMNSVLQCLSNTKPLLEYCLNDQFKNDINTTTSRMKGQLIKVYASIMKSVWKGDGDTYIDPSDFKNQIAKFAKRFVGYSQQDAQEFLIYLLEGLHEDVNRVREKKKRVIDDSNEVETISALEKAKLCWNSYLDHDNSIIVELFVGQLRSALTCTVCSYQSNTFDPFWDLSLPIPKSKTHVTLLDCFNLFTQEEILDKDERPTCAQCKKRQKCKKRFYIQRFPKVLIIHLKRFNQSSYFRSKLSTKVDFPINDLDLSSYAAEPRDTPKYDLYAVSNHSGSTASGHYTAYAKNPYSGKWHFFNDKRVSSALESEIQSAEAYVLFYQLQGTSHL